ncbi:MAG: hypothetical protein ACJAYF_003849 [Arenicella sp.]|jgi:hypothetical protein
MPSVVASDGKYLEFNARYTNSAMANELRYWSSTSSLVVSSLVDSHRSVIKAGIYSATGNRAAGGLEL